MAKHKFTLRCNSCASPLSKLVRIYEAGLDGATAPELPQEEHAIQEGFAFKSKTPFRTSYGPKKDALEFAPQFWMTIKDILPNVELTQNFSRLNGCCGLDGCDGPNRVCSCGAEIGTEMSDCWTSYLFIPDPNNTNWATEENS
jgi:hypothetical protein